jgi:hypothetical protein
VVLLIVVAVLSYRNNASQKQWIVFSTVHEEKTI